MKNILYAAVAIMFVVISVFLIPASSASADTGYYSYPYSNQNYGSTYAPNTSYFSYIYPTYSNVNGGYNNSYYPYSNNSYIYNYNNGYNSYPYNSGTYNYGNYNSYYSNGGYSYYPYNNGYYNSGYNNYYNNCPSGSQWINGSCGVVATGYYINGRLYCPQGYTIWQSNTCYRIW